jgi:hypothetical protein
MVLSWSVFLSYRVLILYAMTGQWIENDAIPLFVISGLAVAYTASFFWRGRRSV